jgi:hypothetical protein
MNSIIMKWMGYAREWMIHESFQSENLTRKDPLGREGS